MKNTQKLLSGALASVFAFAAVPTYAAEVDGPEVNWRLSVWGNPRAFTAGAEHLVKRLKEKTDGKFNITIGYGEQYSKDRENLDSIKMGAIEGAYFCNFYHPGKNPAFMVFSLPFLPLSDWDVNVEARKKLFAHPTLQKDMDQWDAFVYAGAIQPQYEFMGVGEPPHELEDWKGKRVRAGGGLGDAMVKLGAQKTTTTATEVYTSLDRGTMDAVAFPYSYAHAAYRLPEVSTWFTSNMGPGTGACPLVFSKTAFNKLPPQYQQLTKDLLDEVYAVQVKTYQDMDNENLPEFRKQLTEVVYTPEQIEEFRRIAAQPVWDEWVEANKARFDGQELIDEIMKIAKDHEDKKN